MMDNTNGITPVMPIGGYGDGFGGNSFMWIFGLLILLGLFNGNGFGGYGNNGLDQDINRGFDNQNTMANQREILAAVNAQGAAGIAATNQSFHDNLAVINDKYAELQRDIAANAISLANVIANQNSCCCETKQLVMQNNYDGALRDAATNANFTAQIQSVKDLIAKDKIESLQNQVNALTLQNQLAGVVRYPNNTTYAVPSPCFGGCGCNM